jgi:hypothetical protein
MAVEAGYVRRIYLRDQPPAGALDVSRSGTSIGRWEDATLVVETTGLDPKAQVVPGSVLGRNASVVERIALVDADTLEIEATLTAPDVLESPTLTSASRAIVRSTARRGRIASTRPRRQICRRRRPSSWATARDSRKATPACPAR